MDQSDPRGFFVLPMIEYAPLLAGAVLILWERVSAARTAKAVASQIADLHKAHLGPQAMNEDGVPKWYNQRRFERTLETIAKSIERQTILLEQMAKDNHDIRRKLDALT